MMLKFLSSMIKKISIVNRKVNEKNTPFLLSVQITTTYIYVYTNYQIKKLISDNLLMPSYIQEAFASVFRPYQDNFPLINLHRYSYQV